MPQKQRVFIYDRKEMGVLLLLGVMVAVFAFTLGVHLGKRVGVKASIAGASEPKAVTTLKDTLPNEKELSEQTKVVAQVADESLSRTLHDEIERTGLKLDVSKQVDLPKNPKSGNAGATTLKLPSLPAATQVSKVAQVSTTPQAQGHKARFTLQIGSFPAREEAQGRVDLIKGQGLNPIVREADVRGRSWFRVYLGEFPSKTEAEKAGELYRSKHVIDSFVVAKITAELSH